MSTTSQGASIKRLMSHCEFAGCFDDEQLSQISIASAYVVKRLASKLVQIMSCERSQNVHIGSDPTRKYEFPSFSSGNNGNSHISGYDSDWTPLALIGVPKNLGVDWAPAYANLRRPDLVRVSMLRQDAQGNAVDYHRIRAIPAACVAVDGELRLRQLQIHVDSESQIKIVTSPVGDEDSITVVTWLKYRQIDGSSVETEKEAVRLERIGDESWLTSRPLDCPQPLDCASEQVQFCAAVPTVEELVKLPIDCAYAVIDDCIASVVVLPPENCDDELILPQFKLDGETDTTFSWLLSYQDRDPTLLLAGSREPRETRDGIKI